MIHLINKRFEELWDILDDSQTKHRKNFLTEKETRDFIRKIKVIVLCFLKKYMIMWRYKLCCHFRPMKWKYKTTNTHLNSHSRDGRDKK